MSYPEMYSISDSSFGRQNRIGHARVTTRTRLCAYETSYRSFCCAALAERICFADCIRASHGAVTCYAGNSLIRLGRRRSGAKISFFL